MRRFPSNVRQFSNPVCSKIATRNIATASKLHAVATALKQENNEKPVSWDEAKPYSEIPGPSGIFGGMLNFLPGGKYYNIPLYELNKIFKKEYGDIVKFRGFFGIPDTVLIYNPKCLEQIYRLEGPWPYRRDFASVTHFRKNIRPDIFGENSGVLVEQGEKWRELRGKLNPVMMQPRIAKQYITPVEEIVDEFIQRIRKLRDSNNELPSDFLNEMNKWSLESIACIALDSRLGCLKDDNAANSDSKQMIQSIHDFFEGVYKLELLPSFWKYIRTPMYYKLMRAMETMTNITHKRINEAIEVIKNRPEQKSDREASVLEKLLKIDRKVAIVFSMDMIGAGVDTTSYATAILLYLLGINPRAQEKLREELKTILPEKDSKLTANSFDHAPYLRACMKEASRMIPIAGGTIRRMPMDLVILGYQIPKGIDVAPNNQIPSMEAEQYPNPEKFIPERWLSNQDTTQYPSAKTAHPFSHVPFGFGPRSCIGRRFAELEIQTLISKLLRNHKVEWNHGELQVSSLLLTMPVSPLRYKITEL